MAVVPDPEEDKIELGGIAELRLQALLVIAGSDFGGADFGVNPFDFGAGGVESFVDHPVIAVLVIRGHPAFIPEVEMGGGPRPFQLGQSLVERLGGGATRKGNRKRAAGLEGGASQGFPAGDHGLDPRRRVGEFVQSHPKIMPKTL